jgi:hypothetical protein
MSTQSDSFETLYYADQSSDFGENEPRTSVSQYGSSSIKSNVELLENESDCCCNIL